MFCADFRQILPILPEGTRGQIVAAYLKNYSFWQHVRVLRLPVNMRLLHPDLHPREREQQEILGTRFLQSAKDVPLSTTQFNGLIVANNSIQSFSETVFPSLSNPIPPLRRQHTWQIAPF